MRSLPALLLLPLAWSVSAPLAAQERILSYDSKVVVAADGSLDVTERIVVRAEGGQVRRGIYRDFPTRYKDRYGNRVVVDFEMLGVTRNGQPEPWFTENKPNGVRINTGNDDLLPVPADHAYALHYRTTRQLGFFADHDELYWNAIGTGWVFPIERGSVDVRLPQPVPIADMHAEGFTGAQGASGRNFSAALPAPGTAHWELTQPLAPQQGLTIVLSFPKGLVPAPSRAQRVLWFFKDNIGSLIALLGLLAMAGYCVQRWRRVGRDPRPGTIIARYEPPAGHSPAGLRYLGRMGYDTRCFSSDLLALAVDGDVRIHRQDKLLKDAWTLQRLHPGASHATVSQRALLDKLFRGGSDELKLDNTNASTMQSAQAAHTAALKAQYQPSLFKTNARSILVALAIEAVATALAFVTSGGAGLPVIIACTILMTAVLVAFAILVKAPTPDGRKLLDEVEGLKLYLGVAERDELARLPGPDAPPPLDADRYQRLLPHAVALDVEEAWTKQFTLAVGAAAAAAATAAMSWYSGARAGDLGSFASSIGSSLSSQIASSSSPPGSSSGGGGFSGGGGGGGGGGGR
jgi:uncharacterized membrane protein YgcG